MGAAGEPGARRRARRTTSGRTCPRSPHRLRAAVPEADLLVVDDAQPRRHRASRGRGSPRPTPPSTCCTAPGKAGLGAAYVAGFRWALARGYDVARRDGRRRVARAGGAAAAARRAAHGATWCSAPAGSPAERCATGRRAPAALPRRQRLRPPRARPAAADATGGYRAYRAAVLARSARSTTSPRRATASRSTWPGRPGGPASRVVEVPITFTEREHGSQQDEPRHRRRGAVAGHRRGAVSRRLAGAARPADPAGACGGRTAQMPALLLVLLRRRAAGRAVRADARRAHDRRAARRRPAARRRRVRRGRAGPPGGGHGPGGRSARGHGGAGLPAREVADGALLLVGGTLLLTPGFVTDAVGLLLVLPPTRALLRRRLDWRCPAASWLGAAGRGRPGRRAGGGAPGGRRPPRADRSSSGTVVDGDGRRRHGGTVGPRTTPAGPDAAGPAAPGGSRPVPMASGVRPESPDAVRRSSSGRCWRRTPSRSARTSSRSATVRRSRSMSQWVRAGLTVFGSGSSPSTRWAGQPHDLALPDRRHARPRRRR